MAQGTSVVPLHIFLIGPSDFGKGRLIECATGSSLAIPADQDMFLAHRISGYNLQGVDVEINVYHVTDIERSKSLLRNFYQKDKTCFMLMYDKNRPSAFGNVYQLIGSLRYVLDVSVPIFLVGYEDDKETQACGPSLSQVSFSEAKQTKTDFRLEACCEVSDLTGTAATQLIFDAAHIALTSPRGFRV